MSSKNPVTVCKSGPLRGTAGLPGDKSISHRALLLGALAVGRTSITGLLEGEDVLATAAALRAMGAKIERGEGRGEKVEAVWHVDGVGVGGLAQPNAPLDMGNSGTSARLLMGLVATHPIAAEFVGDASLSRRPMARVMEPLRQMGAVFQSHDGKLPVRVQGARQPMPIEYELPVASAQVKSAILLAGLNTPGRTTVIERTPTRDYTETMLAAMGAEIQIDDLGDGAKAIHVTGYAELKPLNIHVPRDPSSAAFPMVAALIVPDSDILLPGVGMNPTSIGLITTLLEMGAKIDCENVRDENGERVADIRVRYSELKGVDVPAARAPSMIDEYPILAIAAAYAHGTTRMRGLHELRAKESDRLQVMADGLAACGARVEIDGDDLIVHGTGELRGAAEIKTHLDHRICMSFWVAGLAAQQPITIDDAAPIQTSFPGFAAMLAELGTG
jgi:3-phosphoshikimate 1-carboxyvinyltransferase